MRGREVAKVSVSLGPETYAQLIARASRDDVSAAWVVRRAILEMITRAANKADKDPLPFRTIRRRPAGHSKDGRVTVTLDPETHARLLALARRDDMPTSSMVSRAVDELIKRGSKPSPLP
jgi:predicted transcriptional regulator